MAEVRGDETGLSSGCQHKINHPLDNLLYPREHASTLRGDLNASIYNYVTVAL